MPFPKYYGYPNRRYHDLEHLVHGLPEIIEWASAIRQEYQDVDTGTCPSNRFHLKNHFICKAKTGEVFLEPYFSEVYNQRSISNKEGEEESPNEINESMK